MAPVLHTAHNLTAKKAAVDPCTCMHTFTYHSVILYVRVLACWCSLVPWWKHTPLPSRRNYFFAVVRECITPSPGLRADWLSDSFVYRLTQQHDGGEADRESVASIFWSIYWCWWICARVADGLNVIRLVVRHANSLMSRRKRTDQDLISTVYNTP